MEVVVDRPFEAPHEVGCLVAPGARRAACADRPHHVARSQGRLVVALVVPVDQVVEQSRDVALDLRSIGPKTRVVDRGAVLPSTVLARICYVADVVGDPFLQGASVVGRQVHIVRRAEHQRPESRQEIG